MYVFDEIVKPKFSVLTDSQIERILEGAFEICQIIGQKVYSEKALKIFKNAGCTVNENNVKIPKDIIVEALSTIPDGFKLYSRNGEYFLDIHGRNSYFGTGVTTPNILDIYSGERRPFVVKDIELSAKVADTLENIDFVMPLGYVADVKPEIADVYHFIYTLKNTNKPIPFICYDKFGVEAIVEIASEVRGGLEALKEKPFLITYTQSTPALIHEKDALEKLMLSVELGIPTIYYSAPIIGSNSPCTYAGAIAQSIAEDILGLVLSQIIKKGAKMISGMAPHPLDFQTANISVGAPEFNLGICAVAEIFQKLKIPTFGCAGLSDSKIFDEQSAIENCFSTVFNLLSGNNIIHDQGYLEGGMVGSIANIVMGNEIIGMAKRIYRGFKINEETLAFNVIKTLGPGGFYLQEMHTLNNFKKEYWFPSLMDKKIYATWKEDGSKTMKVKVDEKTRELARSTNPHEIDNELFKRLIKIKEKSEKFRSIKYME
jgi:trimethylamine--corrinoid protein Co-methyltransferase